MKKPISLAAVCLCLCAGLQLPTVVDAKISEAVFGELVGSMPNPDRKKEEFLGLYLEAFEGLRIPLASKIEGDRALSRDQLGQMFDFAGRPETGDHRQGFCRAIEKQLADKTYPSDGRRLLIQGLGGIGDAGSVPALEALLIGDDAIEADMARMSLQLIPGVAADAALAKAIKAQADNVPIALGLIDSIAARGSATAVEVVGPFLSHKESRLAEAAAAALGRLGGAEATKLLGAARSKSADPAMQLALELGLLDIANQRGLAGDVEGAGKIFEVLGKQTANQALRTAAMVGLARATPSNAADVVIAAIRSKEPRTRSSGISASVLVPDRRISAGLAAMLPAESKRVQLQILRALRLKGDVSVQEQVVAFLATIEGKDNDLEVATVQCLGPVGSVKVIELLLSKCVSKVPSIREAAQQSLAEIKGNDVANAIEFHARDGKTSEIRAIAVGLFMRNRDRTGLTRIMDFALEEDGMVSTAALSVLRQEAGDAEFRKLLDLLAANKSAVMPVLTGICMRSKNPDLVTGEVITFLRTSENPKHQVFLLSCLPILGSGSGLSTLVEKVGEGKTTSDAALKALSKWPKPEALQHQLRFLGSMNSDRTAVALMVKGISRLVAESEATMTAENRVRYLVEAFELSKGARERTMLLAVMGQIPHPKTAEIVGSMLSDRYVGTVAASAAANLCEKMVETQPDAARGLATQLTKGNYNSLVRGKGQAVLNKLDGKD